jgi:uridine kinase
MRGKRAAYQRYDWQTDALAEWYTLVGEPVVIVEGVYTLRRELWPLYDLTVWIDCLRAIRLARGIARDGENARALWENEWNDQEPAWRLIQPPL